MEITNERDANLKPPPLNSDQLNYLIWRYLQESGYGEAAVKLQRDWNIEPEDLPFAKHIKGPALVSLVQKGLRYYHLSLTIDENGRSSKALQPSMFFFGPESLQPPGVVREMAMRPSSSHRNSSPDVSANGVCKHPRDHVPGDPAEQLAQPAPKRPKKTGNASAILQQQQTPATNANDENTCMEVDTPTNQGSMTMAGQPSTRSSTRGDHTEMEESSASAGINGGRGNGRGMDVDTSAFTGAELQHQDQHFIDPVSGPGLPPPQPPPPTLTNGNSTGIQVDPAKVADLSPTINILHTPDGQHVTKLAWRPNDSNTVAATGVGFCGVWRSNSPRFQHLQQSDYHSIFDSDDTYVSALAWEPNGSRLAVATYTNQVGSLHLYDGADLTLMERPPGSQRVITTLRWLPGGSKLVGLAPYDAGFPDGNKDTAVLLWDLSPSGMSRSSVNMPEILVDVDTAPSSYPNKARICISGEGVVYECQDSSKIAIENKWTQEGFPRERWDYIRCARNSQFTVAASSESSSIWIPATKLLLRNRHNAQIVGLEIRPSSGSSRANGVSEEFATASTDDTIKIWRYNISRNTADIIFKVRSPSLALAYSLDGSVFAGAAYEKLRVWSAEHGHQPLGEWDGTGTEWRGQGVQGDETSTNGDVSMNGDGLSSTVDHAVTWDAEGRKIGFGLGGQIAIVNFQR